MNYAGKKVKIMSHWDTEELSRRITEFLRKQECVVDIQFQYACSDHNYIYAAMIIYE